MKRLVVALVLGYALTGLWYVRRHYLPPSGVSYVVEGSRDRALHGKARRRARRAA